MRQAGRVGLGNPLHTWPQETGNPHGNHVMENA
jgi:hypothetical protein